MVTLEDVKDCLSAYRYDLKYNKPYSAADLAKRVTKCIKLIDDLIEKRDEAPDFDRDEG